MGVKGRVLNNHLCHQGHYPLDERLGIKAGEMSAEVLKLAALVGVEDEYGTSRELLLQTAQLDLSPNSIRRACLEVGQQVEDWERQALNESQDSAHLLHQRRDDTPPDRLYASMDGYLVRFEDGWHEMKAGAFWSVSRKGQAEAIEYYTDTAPAEAFSDLVWARAVARRAHLAHELVFIADGARWIWRIVNAHFPNAIQIVDWFHASSYLVNIAHAAFGEGNPQACAWLEPVKAALYDGRLGSVIRACRALAPLAAKAVADARSYFASNRSRLRYAHFRARGLQSRSGAWMAGVGYSVGSLDTGKVVLHMGLMDGKVALIFGVANKNSIAWGITKKLHDEGATIALSYAGEVLEKRVKPLAAEIGCDFVEQADVTRDEDLDAVFEKVKARYGRIDTLVHCVAFANREDLGGRFVDISREGFKLSLDISAYSLIAMAKRAEPLIPEGGSIMSLTYYAAEKVMPKYHVMAVAKSALESITRYLANDLGPQGIRVNAISAGPIKTLAAAGVPGLRMMLKYSQKTSPLRKLVSQEDVGNCALFLASDLSASITGEVIYVDAGYNILGMTLTEEDMAALNGPSE